MKKNLLKGVFAVAIVATVGVSLNASNIIENVMQAEAAKVEITTGAGDKLFLNGEEVSKGELKTVEAETVTI